MPTGQTKPFEIGLVMSGTVSAGAYTAGVLDFLIQALDEWTKAKQAGDAQAPQHDVLIRSIAGTSGGGVNAALLLRFLGKYFPPVSSAGVPGKGDQAAACNPLYDTWVNRIDMRRLLTCEDLEGERALESVLNSSVLDEVGDGIIDGANYAQEAFGTNGAPNSRPYLPDPLQAGLTVTNLSGVPYRLNFQSAIPVYTNSAEGNPNLDYTVIDHSEVIPFSVRNPTGTPVPDPDKRPDGFHTGYDAPPTDPFWQSLKDAALATAAFPLVFKTREVTRPLDHYRHRTVSVQTANGTVEERPMQPDWAVLSRYGSLPDTVTFPCIDGGAAINPPASFVADALLGPLGKPRRDVSPDMKAMVLVDPLIEPIEPFLTERDRFNYDPTSATGRAFKLLVSTLGVLVAQSRFGTTDLRLASDANLTGRYLIAPQRTTADGATRHLNRNAIVGAGMGGFLAFYHWAYRRHDFLLGRRNCQDFLRSQFLLPAAHPLFAGWTARQRETYAPPGIADRLPIIPLLGSAKARVPVADWPTQRLYKKPMVQSIDRRLEAVVAKVASGADVSGLLDNFIASTLFWVFNGERRLNDALVKQLSGRLSQACDEAHKHATLEYADGGP